MARSRKASAPKATTWACACWSGKRQAVVSTNDVKGNGADALAERAVAMARVAPEDQFAGLADAALLAREFPDLDLVDPALPGCRDAGAARARRRGGCARRQGRQQVGRRQRRRPASAAWCWSPATDSAAPMSARAIRCPWWRSPAKAPAWSATTILPPRCMPPISKRRRRSAQSPASAQSSGSIRARSRRGVCRSCSIRASPTRWSGHSPRAINGASIARKTSFLKDRMGEKLFRAGHPHRRRSAAQARPALASVRRRRRRRQGARCDRGRRAQVVVSRLGDRARAVADHDRPRVARRVVVPLPFADQPASRSGHGQRRSS